MIIKERAEQQKGKPKQNRTALHKMKLRQTRLSFKEDVGNEGGEENARATAEMPKSEIDEIDFRPTRERLLCLLVHVITKQEDGVHR